MTKTLAEQLETRALVLGFVRFGVAAVEPLGRDAEALRAWLAAGHHGTMRWMDDTVEVRCDPANERMLPNATRVIALATPYARAPEPSGPGPAVVARYARGRDYHNVIQKRLRSLVSLLRDAGHRARAGVDSLPVMERAWAQRAGIGFIGKNTCLIIPGVGSHVFLSTIVTDAPLETSEPMPERCGSCRLCLDACPTEAFTDTRQLDARRCISYLTIEHRGPIDESLRAALGPRLFGCDDCQDVCPFNKTSAPADALTRPFARDVRLDVPLERLLTMDDAEHATWAVGSPLRRAKRAGLARNAALVLGNVGDPRHLPALEHAAEDPDEAVRDAARWSIARITERIPRD